VVLTPVPMRHVARAAELLATVTQGVLPPAGQKWLSVAAVTMTSQANTEANLQTFYAYMEQAASNGADVVVFPEVALQGCPAWREDSVAPSSEEMAYVQQTAETIPGPSTSNVVAKAKELNLFVVFGMTEKDAGGALYNANVLVGPHGVIGKHRKTFHVGNDSLIWSRGSGYEVLDSPLGGIGLMICAEMYSDGNYPGPVLAAQGADLLLSSSAWWSSVAYAWDMVTVTNAVQAKRWHVVSEQVGTIGHALCYGHSRIVDPQGTIVCDTGSSEGLVTWVTDILIDANPFEHRPFILTQPTNQFVHLGSNATFGVSAFAYDPASLTYQWQANGANILDATNATLTLTNVQLADEGVVYAVVVTDSAGSVMSASANLWVLITPVILQPPLSQSVVEGGSVTLSAVISGYPPPFLFHWRRGMFTVLTNILQEERTCFFTLANVQMNQGGQYRLYITNAASPNWTAVSATFNLTVLADTDADKLPDAWETACGLCQTNANHSTADDDSDGLTNEQEYTASTDPTNALSYLKVNSLTLAEGGTATTLGFLAVSNKTYTVQYRDSLDSGEWSRLADVAAVSSNRVVEISDLGAPTVARRFYRLVTPRAP
jgi:predicted amidohydrolase